MQPINFVQQWKEDVLNSIQQSGRKKKPKIQWLDKGSGEKDALVMSDPKEDLIHKVDQKLSPVSNHKKDSSGIKKILKVKLEPKKEEKKEEEPLKEDKPSDPRPSRKQSPVKQREDLSAKEKE